MLQFGRPLPANGKAKVSSGWSQLRDGKFHRALDIPIATGTPITAIAPGIVSRVQTSLGDNAGLWVAVTSSDGVIVRYMHMSKPLAKLGAHVQRGEVLGLSGSTGNSALPHLHIDVSVPTSMLPAIEAVVGKPKSGWFTADKYGWRIPAEPWIPVDGYNARTIADAIKQNIPLYKPRPLAGVTSNPLLLGAAIAGVGLLLLR